MKKIAIIGTAGVPGRYGGFETLAHHLVTNLNTKFQFHVYNSQKVYEKNERPPYWQGARIHYLPFKANGIQSIIYDIISVIHAIFYADVLLILGVSGGIIIPFVRLFTNRKIIVNIDGMEWRREKWGAWVKRFLKFSELLAVKYSHADVADNEAIKRYTSIYYKTLSHQIEYGADHVQNNTVNKALMKKYPFMGKPYAFKVARIEPENNIHMILRSFANLPKKNIVMVGNWNSNEYGKEMLKKYKDFKNIFLLDPVYDQEELDQIRSNCYVYIHGHSAGGTNPSLVEAMYLELPIVSFDVSYNRSTTDNEAIYYKDTDELTAIIENTTFNRYKSVAERMKHIANRKYTWGIVSRKYANIIYSFDHNYVKKQVMPKLSKLDYRLLLKYEIGHMRYVKPYFK